MPELHLLLGDEVVHVRAVGESPIYIGRAATNDLVLSDDKVSSRHAVVWAVHGEVRVKDLASKNGTFVNERRIDAEVALAHGDRLRLGRATTLRVVALAPDPSSEQRRALLLEQVGVGVRHALRSDRFTIGGRGSDLEIPGTEARLATLVLHDQGEVWLGTDLDERELGVDEVFEVGGLRLAVREVTDERTRTEVAPTEARATTRYPYRLAADLDAPTGPRATLVDPEGGRSHVIDTEHRATLLYVLARQILRDRDQGVPVAERGWISDDEVAGGVWGRDRHRLEPNNYHVLVCRLRKELKDAGFDGWFIEKRRKFIRVRLEDVTATP